MSKIPAFVLTLLILTLSACERAIPSERISEVKNEIASIPEKTLCIKNPQVRFFMYHYIRDYDIHDNQTTKNLSVPPKVFEEQMQKIQSLVNDKKITLM